MTETYTEWEIVYRGNGAWGTGKGSNLTQAEVDNNFFSLDFSVSEVEDSAHGGGISNVAVVDGQITFTLYDGRTFGPFPVPPAAVRFTGEFAPGFDYVESDLFYYGNSLFMVTEDHTSATEFDPNEAGTEGLVYYRVRGTDFIDISGYITGAALTSIYEPSPLFRAVTSTPYYIPAGSTENPPGYAYMRVPPALDTVCLLEKNGTPFGAIEFLQGQQVGTVEVDSDTDFDTGDLFSVSAPIGHTESETETGTEGHGKDLSFTLKGVLING